MTSTLVGTWYFTSGTTIYVHVLSGGTFVANTSATDTTSTSEGYGTWTSSTILRTKDYTGITVSGSTLTLNGNSYTKS
jgi:hypothetical protein